MKVYVVSWQYDGGGGFDWFYKESDARQALKTELTDSTWETVAFYSFESVSSIPEEITKEIDAVDWSELHDTNIVTR